MVSLPPFLPAVVSGVPPPAGLAVVFDEVDEEESLPPQAATTRASAASALTTRNRRRFPDMDGPFIGTYVRALPRAVISSDTTRLLRGTGVEGILQAVADDVERQHGDQQGQARERHEPPRVLEDGRRVGDHGAPRGLGRIHADAEERQGGL